MLVARPPVPEVPSPELQWALEPWVGRARRQRTCPYHRLPGPAPGVAATRRAAGTRLHRRAARKDRHQDPKTRRVRKLARCLATARSGSVHTGLESRAEVCTASCSSVVLRAVWRVGGGEQALPERGVANAVSLARPRRAGKAAEMLLLNVRTRLSTATASREWRTTRRRGVITLHPVAFS